MSRKFAAPCALVALGAAVLAGCAPAVADPVVDRPSPESADLPALVAGINDAGLRIYLAAREDGKDTAVSPLSIGLAFGMADAGASGGVADALEGFFGFPGSGEERLGAFNALEQSLSHDADDDLPLVRIANRVFTDNEFAPLEDYRIALATYFGAGAEPVPMATNGEAAAARINAWIEDRTEGLVKDLVAPTTFNERSRLMLVNTLYMDANWANPFDANNTGDYPFTRLDDSQSRVQMMWQGGAIGESATGEGWVAATVPYVGNELEMVVILPDAGGFTAVEDALGEGLLTDVDAALAPDEFTLALPKFRAESTSDLRKAIEGELGVEGMFGVIGLDGIGEELGIDSAVHGVTVIVDEEGTEAGAATAIEIMAGSAPAAPEFELIADRPFLYLVRDTETGAILFLGRVLNPAT